MSRLPIPPTDPVAPPEVDEGDGTPDRPPTRPWGRHAVPGWETDVFRALNDQPDVATTVTYADIVYGGAGRDILIGNTGADRLVDWVGEFNSYIVPFSPFGAFAISRSNSPALRQFLLDLSAAQGADVTRCMGERATQQRLNRHLHYAVSNGIAVSTPQVFIEGQRLCDEDIDMGLMFALQTLAPELLP